MIRLKKGEIMNILVLNCGSSSIKYQLFDMKTESVLAKGLCERIGLEGSIFKYVANGKKIESVRSLPTHKEGVDLILSTLLNEEEGVIKSLNEINAFGHRYVHGGNMAKTMLVTDELLKELEGLIELAPLHSPANLMGIKVCKEIAHEIPNVVVFDTAFHSSMPKHAYLYPISQKFHDEYKIRKYGFHGTSHKFVSQEVAKLLENENLKIITCHIGNGASLAAIENGKVQDTSMGFTPLAGVCMGTRSGDVDPSIIEFICKKTNKTVSEVTNILNKESGLLGVSGISSDSRDIEENSATNKDAALAAEVMAYSITKYIGSYAAVLNGVDAIVWTAGIGENSASTREMVMKNFAYLGVDFDFELNRNAPRGEVVELTKKGSKVKVFIVPTNEELVIARETLEIVE